MDEVSERIFRFYLESAEKHRIPLDQLTHGLPSVQRVIANKRKWYDWDDHVVLCQRFEELSGGPEAAETAAAEGNATRVAVALRAVARYFTRVQGLYWAGFHWFARSLYRHVDFNLSHLRNGQLRVAISIPETHQDCPAFFRMWQGAMRTMPNLIGLPSSAVLAAVTTRRAVYTIIPPPSRDLVSRVLARFRALFATAQLVKQLAAHQDELREAFEALSDSQEDFRAVAHATPDAVILHRAGVLVYVNPAAARMLGVTPEVLAVGSSLLDWIHPDDREIGTYLLVANPDPSAPKREFRLKSINGGFVDLEAAPSRAVRFEADQVALLVARDITDRREAERARQASEQTQRALIDALPDLILRVDRDGRILQIHGPPKHPLSELVRNARGQRIEDVLGPLVSPGGDQASLAQRDAARATQEEPAPRLELTVQTPSGPSYLEWRTVGIDSGQALCIVRDLSEQKRLVSELERAEQMAALGTLAAAVAHEINNPLTPVLASLEAAEVDLMQPSARWTPERVDRLRDLIREARYGADCIKEAVSDVRSYFRADSSRVEPVDVRTLMDATLRLADNHVRHRARVETRYESVPLLRLNPGRLSQVFLNLLVNAAQAFAEDTVGQNTIVVRSGVERGGAVFVEVKDNGPGIAPEVLPHVFEPFVTTKGTTGTGLGLSICQRILSELGGEISVESKVGVGTVFRVHLPLSAIEVAAPAEAAVVEQPRAIRLLVVDDHARLGLTMKMMLEDLGHEVLVLSNGREAVERIAEDEFDVVFCDLMMPGFGGREVFHTIQSRKPGREERIVFMTGGVFAADVQDFLNGIGALCLEKPFRSADLSRMIGQSLRRSGRDQPRETPQASERVAASAPTSNASR